MTIIRRKNYTTRTPPSVEEYIYCNFMKPQPLDVGGLMRGHRLFPGDDTPRIFRDCNLINCEPPPGSTLIMCNTWIIEYDVLTSTEKVFVGGGPPLQIDHHSNFVHAKLDRDTLLYIDEVPPREEPVD